MGQAAQLFSLESSVTHASPTKLTFTVISKGNKLKKKKPMEQISIQICDVVKI